MKESSVLEKILNIGRKIIPKSIFSAAQPLYHYLLAVAGAIIYRFPAKKLIVIGVTGTKGKSTTTELVNAILECAGYKTAVANTIKYKIADESQRNMFKMTQRGRFFNQNFLRKALNQGCTHAIIEVSSEGVMQSRHRFLYLDALIFTNLAPEHIESHGSYENYVNAKLQIAKELETSGKNSALIVNMDDKESAKFIALNIPNKIPYSLHDAVGIKTDHNGSSFQIDKMIVHSRLPGVFNVMNMLGAVALAKFYGISDESIKKGLEGVNWIRGRMEKITLGNGIPTFDVVVDYAHTPDSLKAVYETYINHRNICILGNTGGGRDKWKREEMGKLADTYCEQIILTNEDPYDEDPKSILEDIKKGITNKPCEFILDRRSAINKALKLAKKMESENVAVLITGKGTDPFIMGPNGTKIPWDDAEVAREELAKIVHGRQSSVNRKKTNDY